MSSFKFAKVNGDCSCLYLYKAAGTCTGRCAESQAYTRRTPQLNINYRYICSRSQLLNVKPTHSSA